MYRSPRILIAALLGAALAAPSFAADVLVRNPQDNGVVERFVDQSDGTWARKVVSTPAGTGTTADQVQGNVASGATDSGNPVKAGGLVDSVPTGSALTDGQRANLRTNANGMVYIAVGDNGGNAGADARPTLNGFSGRTGAGTVPSPVAVGPFLFNGTTWDRDSKATTTSRITSAAATTNATSAKASAGTIHTITGYNAAAAVRYLKVYNKASAPTVGTDTPILTIALKPSDHFNIQFPKGYFLSTGIAYALTTGAVDGDTGALTLADIVGLNVNYN